MQIHVHPMIADENCHLSPINHPETGTSPIGKHTESNPPASSSSTTILMDSNSSPSTSFACSSEKRRTLRHYCEFHYVSSRKQAAAKEIPTGYLRHRLCVRDFFFARLTLVSNMMSFLAILGIVLMIIENELTFGRVDNKDTKASWFIKLIITITTVILLGLIFYYHYLDMVLYAFRNYLDDWRVELTTTRILLIAMELLICAIHPMPRSYPHTDPKRINSTVSDSSSSNPYPQSYTAIDVGLGLPMFLRLYLLGRSIMRHSHVVRDVALRSLGYLNHVSIDGFFLIKSYLEHWPIRSLVMFCTLVFFIGSWSLRACDYKTTQEHLSMSDSMWLFVITFTTVGYGDLYPSSYCGRSVAAIIALIGLLLSALVIAILSKKLLLTREQKYVHTFVLNTRLTRKHHHQAANIIKFAMKVWYLKRKNKSTSIQCFQSQRKLFRSIYDLQKIKQEQRSLVDSCLGFTELMAKQRNTFIQTEETIEQIVAIKTEVREIKTELNNLNRNMDTLQKTLNILLSKDTK